MIIQADTAQQNEGTDPTEGQGNVVDDGRQLASAGSDDTPPARRSGAATRQGGAAPASAAESGAAPPQLPAADDPRDDKVEDLARAAAIAEARKAIESATIEIHSTAWDKEKARRAAADDYKLAVAPDGIVWAKFKAADADFERTAGDMADKVDDWIAANLSDPKARLRQLLEERRQLGDRLRSRYGERERARAEAQSAAKRWSDAFAAWSKPGARASALIGEYADKIRKLNAEINNDENRDLAIFTFWFEVAPKHLQLRVKPLPAEIAQNVEALREALKPDNDLRRRLKLGKDRDDGSLFLDPALDYAEHRKTLLTRWAEAADKLGEAEAAYKLRPDDAAALKQRADKLKDDGWQKTAAEILKAA
ncbi:hypothetical protein [Sphingosinicella sp. BN140058]|uniref:hypothetical protein n=1 Tax=Sphingosinicella sp. BN140058 TaxID=1892855 RepID=UPI001012A084|nr:hypothetical protein [Sphingosinicella sp. BN140058]QAY79312.1 hypothetical protein ETR14_24305 [Sphingosinicella sp. BN140058]